MMYQTSHLFTIQANSLTAVDQATRVLQETGFLVIPSFDLQVARSAHTGCTCPNHDNDQCDCQMLVLLVYAPQFDDQQSSQRQAPLTIVVHSSKGQTRFELVDSPQQPVNRALSNQIQYLLTKISVPSQ